MQEVATLGGGCFWCLEAVYEDLRGVLSVESGYMGGTLENPSYRQVCTGTTGHIEVVQLTFLPEVIPYSGILEVFFLIHDPSSRDRQGNDAGPQYRSAIFTHSPEQHETAAQMIRELDAAGVFGGPIVTELQPAGRFYRAEDYHQGYFRNHPYQPYCRFVVAPKLAKFHAKFPSKSKSRGESS